MNIKKVATIGVIITLLLCISFFLMYEEYNSTFIREEQINNSANIAEKQILKTSYKTIKRESKDKVERIAADLRAELNNKYKDTPEQFSIDYHAPSEDSELIKVIDKAIHSPENRFLHVESDANDMFVTSMEGIISDKSEDCSVFGITRNFEQEISMHYDKNLAKQALDSLIKGDNSNIFWRFKKTPSSDKTNLKYMDINDFFKLPYESMKDYEFLTVAYIDKYGDILGGEDVSVTGHKNDTKKLAVVQGFNLYEQVQSLNKEELIRIEKDRKINIAIVKETRSKLSLKLILNLAIIFIGFFAMASIQNDYREVGEVKDGKHK